MSLPIHPQPPGSRPCQCGDVRMGGEGRVFRGGEGSGNMGGGSCSSTLVLKENWTYPQHSPAIIGHN